MRGGSQTAGEIDSAEVSMNHRKQSSVDVLCGLPPQDVELRHSLNIALSSPP